MDLQIRRAAESDLPSVLAIQGHCAEAAQWTEAGYRQCLSEHAATPCLVAESQAAVVGFLVYRPAETGEGEILNLGVEPAARRRGVARALVERAFADTGRPVYLEVRASNSGAIGFYRRLGFEEAGRRVRYYSHPAEDAIVMRRAAATGEESGKAV